MKTYKKLLVGAVSLLVMGLFFMVAPKHTAADTPYTLNDLKKCNTSFKWINYGQISCQLGDKGTVVFTDSAPDQTDSGITSGHFVFSPPSPDPFCGPDDSLTSDQGAKEGLVVQTNNNYSVLYFNEGYPLPNGGPDHKPCYSFSDGALKSNYTEQQSIDGSGAHPIPAGHQGTGRSAIVLQPTSDGNGVQSFPYLTGGNLGGPDNSGYSFVRWKSEYDTTVSGTKFYLFAQNVNVGGTDNCSGDILAVATDKNDNSALAYEFTLGVSGYDWSKYPSLDNLNKNLKHPNCYVNSINFGNGDFTNPTVPIYISPSIQNVSKIGTGDVSQTSTPPGGTKTGGSCETNGEGWALTWIACPVLDAASGLADKLLGLFEDQLAFSVDQLGNPDVATSGAYKIRQSWAIFRDIALALIVIVMLIMVFSQAISFGPFDAYTVRKLLPKLIAAVILIQLSWFGVVWLIDLVNAVSRGIADIMFLPFGGAEKMDLWHLLASAHLSQGLLTTLNFATLAVGVALGAAYLFTMLGIGLTVVLALLAAFVTLVFRKILLILVLIFAPIAVLLWILPGTERYYKMWRDNFLKALFMFPLIVALVSAGRIFASVVGTVDSNQFLSLLLIMIGFFGPLFLLPKTFKWGGQAMTMAGNFANTASSKIGERPKKFLDARQEGWSAERKRQSEERFTKNEGIGFNKSFRKGFGVPSVWRRPIDLAKSGKIDPTLWGRRKETAMRKYRAAGVESEETDMKLANQEFSLLASQSDSHDDFARKVGGAKVDEVITWTDRFGEGQKMKVTRDMKRAGMNGMAKFGTDQSFRELGRILNELNHGDAKDQVMAERFRDDQVSTLKPRMDYLYRGASKVPGGSDFIPDWDAANGRLSGPIAGRVDALNPDAFASMEAPDMEAMLAGLSHVANDPANPAAQAAAVASLRTVYAQYEAALANDQIRRSISPSLNQAMKAHLDDTGRADRNAKRLVADPAAVEIELVPAAATATTPAIAARINADGTIT